MFKQITALNVSKLVPPPVLPLFAPIGDLEVESVGFKAPEFQRIKSDLWADVVIERKTVPADALKRETDKLCAQVASETGRVVGSKQRKELKQHAFDALLARVLPKRKVVPVLVSGPWTIIGSTSGADVDAITTLLVRSCEAELTAWTPERLLGPQVDQLITGEDSALLLELGGKAKMKRPGDDATATFSVPNLLTDQAVLHALETGFSTIAVEILDTDGLVGVLDLDVESGLRLSSVDFYTDEILMDAEDDDAARVLWSAAIESTLQAVTGEFGS